MAMIDITTTSNRLTAYWICLLSILIDHRRRQNALTRFEAISGHQQARKDLEQYMFCLYRLKQ